MDENAAAALSDAEILGVLAAANAAAIDHGHLVVTRLTDDALRKYAGDMIRLHTQAQARLFELDQLGQLGKLGELGELDEDNWASPLTEELRGREQAVAATLESQPVSLQLDRSYAQAEVQQHRALLELIDYALLPESRSKALRVELLRTRDNTQKHLRRASLLAERLESGVQRALSSAHTAR